MDSIKRMVKFNDNSTINISILTTFDYKGKKYIAYTLGDSDDVLLSYYHITNDVMKLIEITDSNEVEEIRNVLESKI